MLKKMWFDISNTKPQVKHIFNDNNGLKQEMFQRYISSCVGSRVAKTISRLQKKYANVVHSANSILNYSV